MNAEEFQAWVSTLRDGRSLTLTLRAVSEQTGLTERTLWTYHAKGVPQRNKSALKSLEAIKNPLI